MSTTIEIERKYDVTADFALPDLTTVTDVASVAPAVEHHLDAIYLDTSDHRLSAHRMTLRRRTGGHDSGWHLKQPTTGGDRRETRLPLGEDRDEVPSAILDLIRPLIGGSPLVPVARIRTCRREQELLAADGTVVALVADDTVEGTRHQPPAGQRRWREVEVELVHGGRDLLDTVEAVLHAAGARTAGSPSKLARALAVEPPAPASR